MGCYREIEWLPDNEERVSYLYLVTFDRRGRERERERRRLTVGRKSGQKGTAERNAGYWGLSHVQFSRRESMDLS